MCLKDLREFCKDTNLTIVFLYKWVIRLEKPEKPSYISSTQKKCKGSPFR